MGDTFRYTIPARETTYNGTIFRSELEASWAAFFDLRGIGLAEYEPAVPFQSWRPDFSIPLANDDYVFAEVKPYRSQDQWVKDPNTLSKITRALRGSSEIAVLLGSSPILPSCFKFMITPAADKPEEPEFEAIDFGPIEDMVKDWKEARNTVRWKHGQ